MEASGGMSVADLVERHTGSRPDLAVPPPPPPAQQPPRRQPPAPARSRMPVVPPPQATQPPRPAPGRPMDGPPPARRPQGPGEPSGNWPQPDRGARQPAPRQPNGAAPSGPPAFQQPAATQSSSRLPNGTFGPGAATQSGPRQPAASQSSSRLPNGGFRQGTATQSGPRQPAPPSGTFQQPSATQSGPRQPAPRQGTATRSGPRIPNQVPGQASMPPQPQAPQPAWPTESPSMTNLAPAKPASPTPPPRRPAQDDMDPICLTTEMEPISEETQKRRQVDHTLARFSKVHDELRAEEREKKAKRRKLRPWSSDDELDRLDEVILQTPQLPGEQPTALVEPAQLEPPAEETRLQKKKNRRRQRSALAGKVFAGSLAILIFLATGVAWGFKHWVDSNQRQVDALDQNSSAILDRDAQNGDENFLMVGSDSREGASAEDGVGDTTKVNGARADTIMIAHVPANRARAVVISFPRDLEVDRPACEDWDSKTGKYLGKQIPAKSAVKLNSIYYYGGPKCVTKVVQAMSGININHFVGIDFNGFKEMVDAVQGVQVCVEKPLKDNILGVVVKDAGKEVTLTGDKALDFVRARHVQGDPTSDYGRITRQQRFLSSLLRKAMSSQVLLDPGKLTGFVQAFSRSTFGDNLGIDQLFKLGQSMQGLETGRVTFITVPTVGTANARGNETLRRTDNDNMFKAIRTDQALPGEAPAPAGTQPPTNATPPTEPVDPKTIKLQVLNGGNTKITKAAAKTGDKLKAFGYTIVRTDNATEKVQQTVIKYGKDKEAAAKVLASSVPGAQLQEDASATGALLLVLGPEFNGEVVAPNAGGAPTGPAPTELPKNLSTVNADDVTCA